MTTYIRPIIVGQVEGDSMSELLAMFKKSSTITLFVSVRGPFPAGIVGKNIYFCPKTMGRIYINTKHFASYRDRPE